MSQAAIIGVVVIMMMSSSVGAVALTMGGDDEKKTGPGPSSPGPSSPGPSGGGSSTPSPSGVTFHSSTLPTDATIVEPGEITDVIKSPNNEYSLVFQGDDNLCVNGPTAPKWCLMSQDIVNGRAHFQTDGNLCVYGDNNGVKCTMSYNSDVPSGQHRLVLKNDGTMYVDHGTGVSGQSLVTNW
jgi:hypothetical protein